MKHFLTPLLPLIPLALASPLSPREAEVDYSGHQAYRIRTHGKDDEVYSGLSSLKYAEWGHRKSDYVDVSVPGDDVEKLKEMGWEMKMMHGNLGDDIKKEKGWRKYRGE